METGKRKNREITGNKGEKGNKTIRVKLRIKKKEFYRRTEKIGRLPETVERAEEENPMQKNSLSSNLFFRLSSAYSISLQL